MNDKLSQKVITSLFQIPEDFRSELEKLAVATETSAPKVSINTCIVNALEEYLNQPLDSQLKPVLPKVPLRAFTVRTSSSMKQAINHCAAIWQLKSSFPISMNAVVNTAILVYLQKNIAGYQPPF